MTFAAWQKAQPLATGQQMCEAILEAVKAGRYSLKNKATGRVPETWQEIWNYSPTGELAGVYKWYRDIQIIKFLAERSRDITV